MLARCGAERVCRCVGTVAEAHDGHDLLAPLLARAPADHDVVHGGVAHERRLDLLGEDLLPARVDRDRVTPVQLDDPVGAQLRPVAGHGVAHAVHRREGPCRLLGVAEVAERDAPTLRQPAHPVVAGGQDRRERLVEHEAASSGSEAAGRDTRALGRHLAHLPTGLRRAHAVDDHDVGQALEQLLLGSHAQGCAAREDHRQPREVVGVNGEVVEQRPGEGVADDLQEPDALTLAGGPHVDRVEALDHGLDDDRVAPVPSGEPDPVARPVHERRSRKGDRRAGGSGVGGDRLVRLPLGGGGRVAAAEGGDEDVGLAPEHALGHAGRAARVEDVEVVG